jgi:hypothetical protein
MRGDVVRDDLGCGVHGHECQCAGFDCDGWTAFPRGSDLGVMLLIYFRFLFLITIRAVRSFCFWFNRCSSELKNLPAI